MNFQDGSLQRFNDAVASKNAAEHWLQQFEIALASQDAGAIGKLFHHTCHWRDVLAFTWDLSAFEGRDAVVSGLVAQQENAGAHDFFIPDGRKPPRKVKRVGNECIEAIFEFSLSVGRGSGIVRLTEAENGELLAWHVSTTLQELEGHAEKIGENRPTGAAYSRNFGGDNWEDARRKALAYDSREPTVLVIGGAQAGLSIAARLNQLGIDNLVVESWPRIGDSWRKRYHSLALHNSIHLNHLPYMEFPPTWPKYIPKDMLGLWFEFYAEAMEINCWTDTEFVAGEWSPDEKCWNATLRSSDGTERVLRPRHLVFANGVSSYPLIPDLPGLESFEGTVIHSEGFDSGAPWTGKRALILGTGSSANDIALDLHSFDVQTTLIQRGSTTVVSIDPSARLNEAIFDEGPPLEDCDLIVASATPTRVGVAEATMRSQSSSGGPSSKIASFKRALGSMDTTVVEPRWINVVWTSKLCKSRAISLALEPVPKISARLPVHGAPLSKPSE